MSVNIADHHAASDTSKSPHSHSISAVVSKSDSNILDINCDTFFFFFTFPQQKLGMWAFLPSKSCCNHKLHATSVVLSHDVKETVQEV